MVAQSVSLPRPFVWRRLHSLFGLWIVLFLIEHMLTNSQAALLIGENGEGFIRAVNFLKHLPYLPVIEVVLLGVPILMHGVWGIRIALTSKKNAFPSSGNSPSLTKYSRNHAYSWQRFTSWILLVGIILHVGYMRFYMYPESVSVGSQASYFVRINMDPGLYTVSDRLGVKLYNKVSIDEIKQNSAKQEGLAKEVVSDAQAVLEKDPPYKYRDFNALLMSRYQTLESQKKYIAALEKRPITKNQVIAEAPDFGTAVLLVVRDAFKSPFKCILYTIFVLAAVFHGFNGLWTFMITWGLVLKMRSQSRAVNWCVGIMVLIAFLGLASIWGTYFINLRH